MRFRSDGVVKVAGQDQSIAPPFREIRAEEYMQTGVVHAES
jgi:hypothetical protein